MIGSLGHPPLPPRLAGRRSRGRFRRPVARLFDDPVRALPEGCRGSGQGEGTGDRPAAAAEGEGAVAVVLGGGSPRRCLPRGLRQAQRSAGGGGVLVLCLALIGTAFLLVRDDGVHRRGAGWGIGAFLGGTASVVLRTSRFLTDGPAATDLKLPPYLLAENGGPNRPLNVLSLGGSVTWGATLDDPNSQAYPALLAQTLGARSYRVSEAAAWSEDGEGGEAEDKDGKGGEGDAKEGAAADILPVGVADNVAMRGTGSTVPSMCLQTIVAEAEARRRAGGSSPPPSMERTPLESETNYDVVTVEYSMNGVAGLDLLLLRIRLRYPDALIVYVDLYSNNAPGHSNCIGLGPSGEECIRTHESRRREIEDVVAKWGGVFVELPRPVDPMRWKDDPIVRPWFSDDYHHLSEVGHQYVHHKILDEIVRDLGERNSKRLRTVPHRPRVGSWLSGDRCYFWYAWGDVPPGIELSGGHMINLTPTKFVYELPHAPEVAAANGGQGGEQGEEGGEGNVGGGGEAAVLRFAPPPDARGPTPILLTYMTKGNPSEYPKVTVEVGTAGGTAAPTPSDGMQATTAEAEAEAAPPAQAQEQQPAQTQPTQLQRKLVDPLNEKWANYHAVKSDFVGETDGTGSKVQMVVRPAERTDLPFRMIGLCMCPACQDLGALTARPFGEELW